MDLSPSTLLGRYRTGDISPTEVAQYVLSRLADADQTGTWISRVEPERLLAQARALEARRDQMADLPLYGLPFNVKDCIDVAGEVTTAACPEFAYRADVSSPAVEKVLKAGALYVGKTNMDQFATGLVGVRSPYGVPRNPHNPDFIPGGSSSGTAVSVATGTTSFGLGTDTGGSGRVPAAYCGITGLKPAPGAISRRGMVSACRSFDTLSVYAREPADAYRVLTVMAGYDTEDPFSIADYRLDAWGDPMEDLHSLRIATPLPEQLEFFGNREMAALFSAACERAEKLSGPLASFDYAALRRVGDLMFFGPFAAERDLAVGSFLDHHPKAGVDVVRRVILDSRQYSAKSAYAALHLVTETRRSLDGLWSDVDLLLLPTVGTQYRLAEVADDPLTTNFNNGHYTNFANPLGLAGVAIPCGRSASGVPFGVTFYGPPGSEQRLSRLASCWLAEEQMAEDSMIPASSAGSRLSTGLAG